MKLCRIISSILFALLPLQLCASAPQTLTGVTLNWEPYYGEQLEDDGFISAIAKAAFREMNIDYRIKYIPWKRAVLQIKNGEANILHGAYHSVEREETMYFSDPLYFAEVVFLQKADTPYKQVPLDDANFFNGKTVGVLRGGIYGKAFEEARKHLDIFEYNDYSNAIQMLHLGRVDFLAEAKPALLHYIKAVNLDRKSFYITYPAISSEGIHLAFSKKFKESKVILDKFNKGLQRIKENGTFEKIINKYGMN